MIINRSFVAQLTLNSTDYIPKVGPDFDLIDSQIYESSSKLTIGSSTIGRKLTVYTATSDDHLLISGNAPSCAMSNSITGATLQAKFGLATATNNFATGSAAGDFVISAQNGAILWALNSVEKMRIHTSGRLLVGTSSDPGLGTIHSVGGISTDAPSGGTASTWKLGSKVAATVTLDTANYIEVEIGGVAYKLAIVT